MAVAVSGMGANPVPSAVRAPGKFERLRRRFDVGIPQQRLFHSGNVGMETVVLERYIGLREVSRSEQEIVLERE